MLPFVGPVRSSFMRASDALATQVATYAIPLLILTTTGSTALTGIAFILEWLPRLTAFAVGGPLVDRYRTDRVFRAATVGRAFLTAGAAVALCVLPASGTASTVVVMTVGAATGLLAQVSFIAVETIGAQASRRAAAQAHRVQSVQIGIDHGALLVGPLLGGILLLGGPAVLLAVVAALSAAAAVSARQDSTNHAVDMGHGAAAVLTGLSTGWRTVRGIPALAWMVAGLVASNLALAVTQASAPIIVVTGFGRSSLAVGAMWSTAGVVALGVVAASRKVIDRWGLWPVGAAAAATACVGCLVGALAPDFVTYAAGIGVLMAGEGALTVVLRTLRARLIPAAVFGSTLSVTIVLIVVPMPVAGALVAVLPPTSLQALLLACALLQGVVMAFAFRGLWRHRTSYALPHPSVQLADPILLPAAPTA